MFTQQLYEDTHIGDEAGLCPLLPASVEALLSSYLPHIYDEFTAEMCNEIERTYGCRRLTLADVQRIDLDSAANDEGDTSAVEAAAVAI